MGSRLWLRAPFLFRGNVRKRANDFYGSADEVSERTMHHVRAVIEAECVLMVSGVLNVVSGMSEAASLLLLGTVNFAAAGFCVYRASRAKRRGVETGGWPG